MEKIKSITTAKKLFEAGAKIRIVPNKMRPDNIYADIKKLDSARTLVMDDVRYCSDFNIIIKNLKNYNCNDENGNYLHFYLLEA